MKRSKKVHLMERMIQADESYLEQTRGKDFHSGIFGDIMEALPADLRLLGKKKTCDCDAKAAAEIGIFLADLIQQAPVTPEEGEGPIRPAEEGEDE